VLPSRPSKSPQGARRICNPRIPAEIEISSNRSILLSARLGKPYSADIACQFVQFLHGNEMNLAIAKRSSKRLKVQFCVSWNNGHADAMLIRPAALYNTR
jgi:hypothetical protein